jgi:DUF4097 and DUF4098 domain-containing protein YvlB
MSSPVGTPRRRRSMTGPFVLIIVGIVFLLVNMHVLPLARVAYLFAHYWPVLLILWGVIKLLEYWQAQRDNAPAPGIGAGGIFLIIVLVIGGLVATQAARVNWGELRDNIDVGDADLPFFGSLYTYEDQLTQELPAGASVKIVNDRGAVNVSDSNDDSLHVAVHKKIRAETQKQADEWNGGSKPQITVNGNLVTVNANTQGAGDHPVATDLDIAIPRKAAVNIATKKGDVSVTGRDNSVEISSRRGDVSVEDISGSVNLNLDDSSARVTNVTGDVSVDGRSNTVDLSDVKGSARLNGDFMESLKLSKMGKTVSFKSSRTDMEFAKLDGDLDLDQGDLRADHLIGPLRLLTRSKDITLAGVSGDARVQDENGTVELQLAAPGNVQIDNRQGDIRVGIPGKMGFRVDARVRGGEIQSDFDALKVTNEDDRGTASGTIGNGASHLVLNNDRGTIEIRSASAIAAEPATPATPPAPPAPPASRSHRTPKTSAAPSDLQPTEN